MATTAAVATGTLTGTISSTVDLTVASFGTADAAIVFISSASTANNPQDSGDLGIGFWDGTNDVAFGQSSGDALGVTDTSYASSSSDAVCLPKADASNESIRASASAVTDGIRLTVTEDNTGVDRYVSCVLISGLTNASTAIHTMDGTTNANNITAPGFEPNVVLFATSHTDDGLGLTARLNLGVAHNAASLKQMNVTGISQHGVTTAASMCYVDDDKAMTSAFPNSVYNQYTISDFDSSGFSITQTATNSRLIGYLALEFPADNDFWCDIIDSATSTGTDAITGVGFTPDALILGQSMCTAVDTVTQIGSLAFGVADSTTERCVDWTDDDGQSTQDSSSAMTAAVLNIRDDAPSTDATATVDSFDSDGFTLNYSDGSSSARKMLAICIGDSTAGGGGPTVNGISSYTSINGITNFTSVNGQT